MTYDLLEVDDAIRIDNDTGIMTAYSTDRSKVSYRVSVIGTVWAPVDAYETVISKKTSTKTFMMTYTVPFDPCEDTQLAPFTLDDMSISVNQGS